MAAADVRADGVTLTLQSDGKEDKVCLARDAAELRIEGGRFWVEG